MKKAGMLNWGERVTWTERECTGGGRDGGGRWKSGGPHGRNAGAEGGAHLEWGYKSSNPVWVKYEWPPFTLALEMTSGEGCSLSEVMGGIEDRPMWNSRWDKNLIWFLSMTSSGIKMDSNVGQYRNCKIINQPQYFWPVRLHTYLRTGVVLQPCGSCGVHPKCPH